MTGARTRRAEAVLHEIFGAIWGEGDHRLSVKEIGTAAILAFADAERREGAREALLDGAAKLDDHAKQAARRAHDGIDWHAGCWDALRAAAEMLREGAASYSLTPNHQAPLNGSGERSEYDRGHSDAMESPFVQGMRDVLEQHGLLGAPLDRAMHERMLSNPVSQPQPLSNDGRVALGSGAERCNADGDDRKCTACGAFSWERCQDVSQGPSCADESGAETDRIYECRRCGVMRTKAEGGTVFSVCDACWDVTTGTACDGTGRGMR